MTKPRRALSALLVACTALAAHAQDKSVDASASAPSSVPGAPAAPQVQSPSALPTSGVSLGVDVPLFRPAAQNAAAQAAPQAAAQSPSASEIAVSPSAAGLLPAQPPAASPVQVRQQLGAAVSGAGRAQSQPGAAGAIQAGGVFRRMYDEGQGPSRAARGEGGGPAAGVAGRDEPLADRIDQLSSLARAASPYDAPGLYDQALGEIRAAAREKRLEARMAGRFVAQLFGFAAPQGRRALPGLARAAADAGPGGAEKPLKAVKDWDKLFDAFGEPLPRRDARTQALIAIALDHVKAGSVPDAGQRVARAGSPAAESPVKRLPPFVIPDAAGDASLPELSGTWLEDVLAAHSRNPGTEPGLLYAIARRGAARAVPAAAAAAAGQSARAWLARAWHWLRELYLRSFGPQAVVDLGGGVVARGPASEVSGLARIKRAPTADEARAAVVAVDLSGVDAPYADAMRLLSAKTEMTPARLERLLGSARALSDASFRLTGDPSGRQEMDKLAARLSAQPGLSRLDAELLSYWLGELQGAALSRVELPARDAARRGGPVVLCDLSRDGAILVAAPSRRAAALSSLGFEISAPQSGVVSARLSLSGMGPQARREALAAAVSSAAGRGDASAVSGGAARQSAAALLAYVRANAAQARAAAAQLEAEAPFVRRRFVALGRVTIPQGRFTLERSRRALAGRVELVEVLRGGEGRAVFARKTSLPLPR